MTTAFITGVSGFVGRHLSKYLLEHGWRVSGQDIKSAPTIPSFYQSDLHNRLCSLPPVGSQKFQKINF
jgi:nucleoside-diphosphate-sugar epimerase